jgi:hypothetical protein
MSHMVQLIEAISEPGERDRDRLTAEGLSYLRGLHRQEHHTTNSRAARSWRMAELEQVAQKP